MNILPVVSSRSCLCEVWKDGMVRFAILSTGAINHRCLILAAVVTHAEPRRADSFPSEQHPGPTDADPNPATPMR